MATISIILPVYNSEQYIAQTLDSLLSQTFDDIEIICISDGSTDNSLSILKKYEFQDSRIKVIDKENSGPAQSRNVGLDSANGKFIMFCDSDDMYEPNMCERMYNLINSGNFDYGQCSCNMVIDNERPDIPDVNVMTAPYDEIEVTNKLISHTDGYIWNKIFKKELIDKYQIRFPSGHVHDDPAFVLQYCSVSKRLFVTPDRLYKYRIRDNSIMGQFYSYTKVSDYTDLIYMIKFVIDFMYRNNLGDTYLSGMNTKFMSHLIMGYTYVKRSDLDIYLETIHKYVKELGLDKFTYIQNRKLIEAIYNNDKYTVIDCLNVIINNRITKIKKELQTLQHNLSIYENIINNSLVPA